MHGHALSGCLSTQSSWEMELKMHFLYGTSICFAAILQQKNASFAAKLQQNVAAANAGPNQSQRVLQHFYIILQQVLHFAAYAVKLQQNK